MRTPVRLITVSLILVWATSMVHAGVIYDLKTDWSLASNPNGAWSYNKGAAPLPYIQANWGGIPETFWADSTLFTTPPAWARVETQSNLNRPDHWEIGDVVGHSTTPSAAAAVPLGRVAWTSPSAGVIEVSGKAWDAYHDLGRDDEWRLYINGIEVSSRDTVYGVGKSDAEALFANNLLSGRSLSGWAVSAGDTVVFEIESLTPFGHLVGVDLTINLEAGPTGEVPEPSQALPVLAAAIAGYALRRSLSNHAR